MDAAATASIARRHAGKRRSPRSKAAAPWATVRRRAVLSRFLGELPNAVLREVRPKAQVSRPATFGRSAEDFLASRGMGLRGGLTVDAPPFKLGARVVHAKFGEGVVLGYEGAGAHLVVMVNFADVGVKRLVVAYAGLSAA